MLLWTFVYNFLCASTVSFLLSMYMYISGIAWSHGNSMFKYLGNSSCFPKQLYHFIFLPAIYEGYNFSTTLPILGFFFNYKQSNWCQVVSQCKFDLHFPNDIKSFSCTYWLWDICFEEMSIQTPWPFLIVLFAFLLLTCRSYSYILNTSPFSDTWFAKLPPILWAVIPDFSLITLCLITSLPPPHTHTYNKFSTTP